MAASKFTRNKDYSDDELNNAGGRSTVSTSGLDGEMDEIKSVTDDHADKLDTLLRADNKVADNLLEGHEFSSAAIAVLMGFLNQIGYINFRGEWVTAYDYVVGDLAYDAAGGSTYFCLVPHTSGTLSTDITAGRWTLFAAGSVSLPAQAGHANKALITNGSSTLWSLIGPSNSTGLAPLASPTFTGVADFDAGVKTQKITITTGASIALDFNAGPNQQVDPLSNNVTFSTTNRAAASGETKFIDLKISADSSGPYTLAFPAGWRWITVMPTSIAADKIGFLSLRCYGANDTNVVAAFAVEA